MGDGDGVVAPLPKGSLPKNRKWLLSGFHELRVHLMDAAQEQRMLHAREGKLPAERSSSAHRLRTRNKVQIRAAKLALAFFKGRSYAEIEPTARSWPNFTLVRELVLRFGAKRDKSESQLRFQVRMHNQQARLNTWVRDAVCHLADEGSATQA